MSASGSASRSASGPRLGPLSIAALLSLGIAASGTPRPGELPVGVEADDRVEDRLVGRIEGPVQTTSRGTGATLVVGDAEVWIWSDRVVVPGERIAATGRLRRPRGFIGPGMRDPRARLGRYEMAAQRIEHLGHDPSWRDATWRWAAAIQARWSAQIDDAGGPVEARAALRGIVVGDRRDISPQLDQRWRAVGIYHVLSVSGLHLAVIAGLAFALLRRLAAASPWGGRIRPARWAAPIALGLAIAYTLITGAQLATVRALVVVALVLIASMLDRPVRLVDALGCAAIAILVWRPADLYDPSFQLSFTAVLVLALGPPTSRRGVGGYVVRGVTSSAWVTIATAPITAYHFHEVNPGGVIGNLVLAPLLELAALPVGLLGLTLGEVGQPLVRAASEVVGAVDALAAVLARGAPIGRVALTSSVAMTALCVIALVLVARRRRTRLDVVAWCVMCGLWLTGRLERPPGTMRVTFLDVGQGDAAVIELPDGAVWLVDAGGRPNATALAAAAAPGLAIDRALAAYGHDRIDLAVISHPHPDHYLGLAAITHPIAELWTPDEPPPPVSAPAARSFHGLAAQLAARGTQRRAPQLGLARSQAGVELVVWGPRADVGPAHATHATSDPVRSVNDNSLVIELRYRGRSVLFTGDVEAEGEDLLIAAGIGRVDVVKVPHHGSPTSSTAGLIAATRPSIAVISCGVANGFGFPSEVVIARWRDAGAEVVRTDRDGAITLIIDATGRLAIDRSVVQSSRGDHGARSRSVRRGDRAGQRSPQAGQPRGGTAVLPDGARSRARQHARARAARPDLFPRQPVRRGSPDLRAPGRARADRRVPPPQPRARVPQAQRVRDGDQRARSEPRPRSRPGPRRELPRLGVRPRGPLHRGLSRVPARRPERARDRDRAQPD